MTQSTHISLDEAAPLNSRALARMIAAEMVQNNELPNAEIIRKRIVALTAGSMNPSALTIQTEIRAWYEQEFWPTYHAMGALPENTGVPEAVQNLFQSSFQTMVVQLFAAAKAGFQSEREEYDRQIDEAEQVVKKLKLEVNESVARVAEALDLYHTEARDHTATKDRLDAAADELRELNSRLHSAYELQATHEAKLTEIRTVERDRADAQIQSAYLEARRNLQEIDNLRQRVKTQELTQAAQAGDNRRLVLEHARAESDAQASRTELANAREAHARELERLLATLRPTGSKTATAKTFTHSRKSLRKPTRG
ncbi:hypothetical protein JAB5_27180 [Janthinobacterium sp. HH103]|uniref:hypothetical protein n=1 Tax=unclassified Janthinobacterium TaxID=2610881 RepID=UPI0008938C4E|nr:MULTISPECIES: hypothetical protein [unclassified Janthinobacterium]OEZ69276.1 hypothetical protein JAB2_14620 [Janthinobacterium sp. HH100]OEZ76409.1 hypothetical protein JAB5_27180 [Janthinobacterium sp. HH103]QOU76224.1 hypothetical protein JAB4_057240 [Janthinobacterium sp. HH102]